jgi:hypothetical protein
LKGFHQGDFHFRWILEELGWREFHGQIVVEVVPKLDSESWILVDSESWILVDSESWIPVDPVTWILRAVLEEVVMLI